MVLPTAVPAGNTEGLVWFKLECSVAETVSLQAGPCTTGDAYMLRSVGRMTWFGVVYRSMVRLDRNGCTGGYAKEAPRPWLSAT